MFQDKSKGKKPFDFFIFEGYHNDYTLCKHDYEWYTEQY